VLKSIREVKPDAKVIMLSGQDKIEVAIESMKYGAFDYVIKGETAFSRMENIINYVNEINNIRAANKTYKRVITSLIIILIAIIGISVMMALKLNSSY
jgi:two-component system OmpR family response regulator